VNGAASAAFWARHFQAPWLLPLAVVLPALFAGLVLAWGRARARRVRRMGEPALVARLAPEGSSGGGRGRAARLGLAGLLGGLALAGPRWGLERQEVRTSGVDVVLALDASLSMLAEDERPSRLARMKQEVRRLRALAPGDRVALLAFAGRSYILTPLTTDAGAIELFLDNLDPSVVGQAGSSLSRAIRQGTELLQSSPSSGDRALVVMSDGEAFEPVDSVAAAGAEAAQANVALVTVGFGTEAGATIPVREANTVREKRDADGTVVVTRYDPATLRAAAAAARGTFVPADAPDKAARVRAALAGLRGRSRTVDAGRDLTPRFQLFLAPALLLLLIDTWLAGRTRRRASPARVAASDAAGSDAGKLGAERRARRARPRRRAGHPCRRRRRARRLRAPRPRRSRPRPGARRVQPRRCPRRARRLPRPHPRGRLARGALQPGYRARRRRLARRGPRAARRGAPHARPRAALPGAVQPRLHAPPPRPRRRRGRRRPRRARPGRRHGRRRRTWARRARRGPRHLPPGAHAAPRRPGREVELRARAPQAAAVGRRWRRGRRRGRRERESAAERAARAAAVGRRRPPAGRAAARRRRA
jgi:Ca-activated chloride channel family protein